MAQTETLRIIRMSESGRVKFGVERRSYDETRTLGTVFVTSTDADEGIGGVHAQNALYGKALDWTRRNRAEHQYVAHFWQHA